MPDDQLQSLHADSRRFGTQGAALDYALLLDGLSAEREQGITIDVAYRYFSFGRRRFIAADTPGHSQYTRNMVTGASTADAAVILVDARKGLGAQTRRHSQIVSLLGVKDVVLAVNKMDLVGWEEGRFAALVAQYHSLCESLSFRAVQAIPLSALNGDNVRERGVCGWYDGPLLLDYLEGLVVDDDRSNAPFRLPVQWVNRPDPNFRGVCGLVASGRIAPGDPVRVLPSGRQTTVARIVTHDCDLQGAIMGQSITLVLADDLDVSRGDVVVAAKVPLEVADQFEATIIWMDEAPLLPERRYLLKIGTRTVNAQITRIKHVLNVDTQERLAAQTVKLNEIAVCRLALDAPIPFASYVEDKTLGGFILVDRETSATAGAGLIAFSLHRAENVHRHALTVTKAAHATRLGQTPYVLWFTGLSGAGKSTIANLVEERLQAAGRATVLLDGDNLRHGLNRDLGFTDADRVENVRRTAEVARLMVDAGLIVLVALISPFRADRDAARAHFAKGKFLEVHVDAPLATAEARDPKGLYAKARAGALPGFTGIDSPYEQPQAAELTLHTERFVPAETAQQVITALEGRGLA